MTSLDGNKLVVALFPTDVAKGTVVSCVLRDVGDLVHSMVVLHNLP